MRERPHQQVTTGKETLFKMPSHDGFTVVALCTKTHVLLQCNRVSQPIKLFSLMQRQVRTGRQRQSYNEAESAFKPMQ